MILAAHDEGCLAEVLVIAAVLELQDPRERPLEKQQAADEAHAQFADEQSDFLSYLKLWDFYHQLKGKLSRSQLRKACHTNFLSHNRMREWADIHLQLKQLVDQAGLKPGQRRDEYANIHRAILTGLLSNLGFRSEAGGYSVSGGGKAFVWPGSAVFKARPVWIVAAEVVETTKRYLRTCARIDPRWIEPIAGHLIKRSYSDPQWQRANTSAMALERVSLFGLTIVPGRRVRYGPINPEVSRALMIQHGLVEGELDSKAEFFVHNRQLVDQMQQLQAKLRRHDFLLGDWALFEFYDRRIPDDVFDGQSLGRWLKRMGRKQSQLLLMQRSDVVRQDSLEVAEGDFPDAIRSGPMELPVEYRFEPGAEEDGVTVDVPLEALNQVAPQRLGWLVPGLLEQKVTALIKTLPKPVRRGLVPAADTAKRIVPHLRFGEGEITAAVAGALTKLSGQAISPDMFEVGKLTADLQMNLRVVDQEGQPLGYGRDLDELRRRLGQEAASVFSTIDDPQFNRDGLTEWDFELPETVDVRRGSLVLKAYPVLVDQQQSVGIRLADSAERAARQTRGGLRRLFVLASGRLLKTQVQWLPKIGELAVYASSIHGFDLKGQLTDLIADRALVAVNALPRTSGEFRECVEIGQKRVGVATQEVAELAAPLFEAYHGAQLALEQMPGSKWEYAADDVRQQMQHLLAVDFLHSTPWPWLRHYPRYFRAIQARLAALRTGGLARDRQGTEEICAWWERFRERSALHGQMDIDDPELELFRWMLEEYRVSLFAQKLGTAMTVSGKRLQQQWMKVRL